MNHTDTNTSLRSISEADFPSRVLHSNSPVLVAFWSPWSKPCHVMDPVLLDVAETCADKMEVVKVNADDHPGLSLCFGVQHIPTLLYFEAGRLLGRMVGTVSKEAILHFLSRSSESEPANGPTDNGETL
jgi:thioredoxin 1